MIQKKSYVSQGFIGDFEFLDTMGVGSISMEVFTSLASEIRIKIMEILVSRPGVQKFSELVNLTGMKASSLEYHIKQMVEHGLIAHSIEGYRAHAATQYFLGIASEMNHISTYNGYLQTHIFPFANLDGIFSFLGCHPILMPDLFSVFNEFGSYFNKNGLEIVIGGQFDLDLEARIMSFAQMPQKFAKVTVISDQQNFRNFLGHPSVEMFLQMAPEGATDLIVHHEILNIYFGLIDSLGIVFLPNLEGDIDFQQCFLLTTKEGLAWMERYIENLKRHGRSLRFDPQNVHSILNDLNSMDRV